MPLLLFNARLIMRMRLLSRRVFSRMRSILLVQRLKEERKEEGAVSEDSALVANKMVPALIPAEYVGLR